MKTCRVPWVLAIGFSGASTAVRRTAATATGQEITVPRERATAPRHIGVDGVTEGNAKGWGRLGSGCEIYEGLTWRRSDPGDVDGLAARDPVTIDCSTFAKLYEVIVSVRDRMNPATIPKRLLALDGGGIRGLLTIEMLARLQAVLRDATGAGTDFRLSQDFDDVAGTSTGAIIATCVSLGMSVDEIRTFYLANGAAMFARANVLNRFRYKYDDDQLAAKLRDVFDQYLPAEERARATCTSR